MHDQDTNVNDMDAASILQRISKTSRACTTLSVYTDKYNSVCGGIKGYMGDHVEVSNARDAEENWYPKSIEC